MEITEGRHGPHQSRCAGLRKFEGVCNLDSRSGPLVLLKEFQHVEHALRRLDRGLHLRKVAGRIAGAIRAVERTQTGCRACIRQIFLRHRHRYFPCCATRRFSHQPYCSGQCDHSGSHPSSSAVWAGQFGFHSSSRPSAISVALPSLRMASAYSGSQSIRRQRSVCLPAAECVRRRESGSPGFAIPASCREAVSCRPTNSRRRRSRAP